MTKQTLMQWLAGIGMRGMIPTYVGLAVVIPDSQAIAHSRTWLWDLADYRVTSATGGSIWLMPKDGE